MNIDSYGSGRGGGGGKFDRVEFKGIYINCERLL